ncbi:MAG TPA: polysaccharide deacetylase family protein [Solirubrobacterales bacterium]|nr:polysaccharide deacetylase family protein [Solirubrobacterales bacterium]
MRAALLRAGAAALAIIALTAGVAGAAQPTTEDGGTLYGAGTEPIGCTSRPGTIVSQGPRRPREVALSFDDGPSNVQTPEILTTLDRMHAHATFFEEGRHVAGREELMRQILAAGDEIGNHSFHHPHDPDEEELATTDAAIREATGFEPCLFRPPYGLVNAKVEAAALATHLETILWTYDSADDHHPGVDGIIRHTVEMATPGAIILMHDGGHHPETPEALPGVIEGLRARGFRFVTVTELLGGRMLYPSSPPSGTPSIR